LILVVICVAYGAWRYFRYRAKKRPTDDQLDTRAVQIIEIAGRAALNASGEATQQFHREHPERCYTDEGRLFSDEYLRIGEAAERNAYAEILDIALSSSDTRLADAIRRNDCGARSATLGASYKRHEERSARLRQRNP
jgi:hypothetical protein